jgi:polynucleotide 5'-kinase involved in rRNA processing
MTKYYTLLVIGETGSGKTTLLDAFVNKLTGIDYTDQWRWKLVN